MPGLAPKDGLRSRDYGILVACCAVLFGISLVGGRPLSVHEAVLPQSAREMLVDHDWAVPKSGGRPWLESPPLPQWITVGVASVIGHCDEEWVARIAPAVMGTIVVLLIGYMAGGWYGRTIGMLSALSTATVSELIRYSWLAEDEIFLCAIIAATLTLFVRLEFFGGLRAEHEPYRFFGGRPRAVLFFFAALGATNLAKGVLFGTVVALTPIAGYLLWNRDWVRIRAYCWFWGWLAFAGVALAWPIAVLQKYPDAPQVWFYDQLGRMSGDYTAINQPWWYYASRLPEILAPWICLAPFGIWATWRQAIQQRYSPARFVWCWAFLTPVVLSIPSGKHHHYLLHAVAPWGVLTAFGLIWLREKVLAWPAWTRNPLGALPLTGLAGAIGLVILSQKVHWPIWITAPLVMGWLVASVLISRGLWHPNGRIATGTLFGTVAAGWIALHLISGQYFDRYRDDTAFLRQVLATVPAQKPLLVNSGMGQLDAFHVLFYLRERATPIYNLSYLIDDDIHGDEVYVITFRYDLPTFAQFGQAEEVLSSPAAKRDGSAEERLTLFRLRYQPDIVRRRDQLRISPMQAMNYAVGPYLTKLQYDARLR